VTIPARGGSAIKLDPGLWDATPARYEWTQESLDTFIDEAPEEARSRPGGSPRRGPNANHGWTIRDAGANGQQPQDFHSREKGTDNPPRLVVTFGA
jgi:hypothetical protein